MSVDREAFRAEQVAMAAVVREVLARFPGEVTNSGQVAALMAALPADTPVSIAETVHVDPDLPPDAPTITAVTVKGVNLMEAEPVDVVDGDGQVRQYGRIVPGVQLGAVIVAEGQPAPDKTVAYLPYERAEDALAVGDVDATLAAYAELLRWMAERLTETVPGPDGTPETVPQWVADAGIRARMGIEAMRLSYTADRLTNLRQDLADREAAQLAENEREDPR